MIAVIQLLSSIIGILKFVLIASAIMSWLMAFGIMNMNNQFVATVYSTLQKLTEPMLRPIRRFVPPLGGLDISFIILILALYFIDNFITRDLPGYLGL
ncbi:MAG: YggT family protein [Alphaproteobacteria bacterium]|nr:YggT family protein [Alphaproteobacteria bacterium]